MNGIGNLFTASNINSSIVIDSPNIEQFIGLGTLKAINNINKASNLANQNLFL
ncbi:MAG UNVERIFIED_CONTAM: hypothetical protein LVQ98_05875 [Rickettsiaceae bacterium]